MLSRSTSPRNGEVGWDTTLPSGCAGPKRAPERHIFNGDRGSGCRSVWVYVCLPSARQVGVVSRQERGTLLSPHELSNSIPPPRFLFGMPAEVVVESGVLLSGGTCSCAEKDIVREVVTSAWDCGQPAAVICAFRTDGSLSLPVRRRSAVRVRMLLREEEVGSESRDPELVHRTLRTQARSAPLRKRTSARSILEDRSSLFEAPSFAAFISIRNPYRLCRGPRRQ